jgi:hypothetical protein
MYIHLRPMLVLSGLHMNYIFREPVAEFKAASYLREKLKLFLSIIPNRGRRFSDYYIRIVFLFRYLYNDMKDHMPLNVRLHLPIRYFSFKEQLPYIARIESRYSFVEDYFGLYRCIIVLQIGK